MSENIIHLVVGKIQACDGHAVDLKWQETHNWLKVVTESWVLLQGASRIWPELCLPDPQPQLSLLAFCVSLVFLTQHPCYLVLPADWSLLPWRSWHCQPDSCARDEEGMCLYFESFSGQSSTKIFLFHFDLNLIFLPLSIWIHCFSSSCIIRVP